ncbi:exonuclease V [Lepisosteus oculatus]|nr:PREDICTED: exonuclease V isoform X2 [Lepisosteus oculatus]
MSHSPGGSAPMDSDFGDEISDAEFLHIQSEFLCSGPIGTHQSSHDGGDCEAKPDLSGVRSAEQEEAKGGGVGYGLDAAPKRKRELVDGSPLDRFELRYLCVTDICGQAWCELQVAHGFELPDVLKRRDESQEVRAGASIHLARELEVHDVVPVSAQSREDRWALKFLNVLGMIPVLQAGSCVREMPVFGVLEGIFVMGVIDELHYSHKGELVLNELKTRGHNSLPGRAQDRSHRLQVGLYKLLYDGLVRGTLEREDFIRSLQLQPGQLLGSGVMEHAQKLGLQVGTFGDLLDLLLMNLTYCELPTIDVLRLEYCHQGSGTPIATREVPFDETQLRAELQQHLSYWTGQREARGVDIEEAWKCRYCSFVELCEWRKERLQQELTGHPSKKLK